MTESRRPVALFGVAGLVAFGFGTVGLPHVEGPPPGHTGGFGEPTCVSCHEGSPLNEPGSTLEVIGLGSTYVPGEAYRVTVRLLSFDMLSAGFQASFRFAEGPWRGRRAGETYALDGRVVVVPDSTGHVEYVQHTRLGTRTVGQVAEWTFEWRAPRSDAVVMMHLAANSGSGDNSPLEDLVYTEQLRLTPSTANE